jgi:hypothetical protein
VNLEQISTLRSALSENDSHEAKIKKAKTALAPTMPLTVEKLAALNDGMTAVMDQFLYRFTKMQDSLGTRFLGLYDQARAVCLSRLPAEEP